MARNGGTRAPELFRAVLAVALAGLLLVVVGLIFWGALALAGVDIRGFTPAEARRLVESWGAWSAVGALALMVAHSFLPLPAEIIPLVNGMVFGAWFGIALTWAGAMLGAVLSFALARAFGRPFLRFVLSEDQRRRVDRLPIHPGTLLVVRLIPLISFNLVNYAAGVLAISWWTFLWTTALGILPLTVALVVLGSRMWAVPSGAWVVLSGVVLALWLAWRLRRR